MLSAAAGPLAEIGNLSLPSRFDVTTSVGYRMPFVRFMNHPELDRLVVDFSNVDYIDSCAIGVLISWHQICNEQRRALVIKNCNDSIEAIFKMMSVHHLFDFQ